MYVHFEDWSTAPTVQSRLETLSLPHEERVIKIFASGEDPRPALGRSALTIVESDGSVFSEDEEYPYERRRSFSGPELEDDLQAYGLSDDGQRIARSLFRFSYEQGFSQRAMAAVRKGNRGRSIRHPYESIDGLAAAQHQPAREKAIHLDIFLPDSLAALREAVDYDDPEAVLGWKEGVKWLQS